VRTIGAVAALAVALGGCAAGHTASEPPSAPVTGCAEPPAWIDRVEGDWAVVSSESHSVDVPLSALGSDVQEGMALDSRGRGSWACAVATRNRVRDALGRLTAGASRWRDGAPLGVAEQRPPP
jgi:hypothetical protein